MRKDPRTLTLTAAAFMAGLVAAPSAQAKNVESPRRGGIGYVANELVDQKFDEPLRNAENVFDVYRVIVDWLKVSYPEGGEAMKAIQAFDGLVKKYEDTSDERGKPDEDGKVRTIEMPMSIDQLMKVLIAEAPGAKAKFGSRAQGNAKAQLFTANLLPFLAMRGITYRIRPMAERSFWLHSMAINSLRAGRHELSVNAGKNAMAVFEFLTYPMAQKGRSSIQFHTVSEVQEWIENHLIPVYDVAIPMAEQGLATLGEGNFESVTLTNFLMGPNLFPDESFETANRTFGAAEVKAMISSLYGARAGLRAACAYNLDELGKATDDMTQWLFKQYLKEKVPFGKKPRVGSPSHKRYEYLENYGNLLTLRNGSHGAAIMSDLRQAWKYAEGAMNGFFAANPSANDERMVRTRWIQASQKEWTNKVAPQIRAVLAGPATITDYLSGETIDVDFAGFVSSLPQDLKDFFPASFDTTTPYRVFRFSSGKLIYSNYDYGNPTGWKEGAADDTWRKLFPNISDEKGAEGGWIGPMRAYRAISRTYLGGFIAPVLSTVMN